MAETEIVEQNATVDAPPIPEGIPTDEFYPPDVLARRPDLLKKVKDRRRAEKAAQTRKENKAEAKEPAKEPEKATEAPAEPAEKAEAKPDAKSTPDKAEAKDEPESDKEKAEPDPKIESKAAELLALIKDNPKLQEELKKALEQPRGLVEAFISAKKKATAAAKKERQVELREAALSKREREWNDLEDLAKTNKLVVAKRLGITFRELAEEANRQGEDKPPEDAKYAALERKLETALAKLEQYDEREQQLTKATQEQRELGAIQSWLGENIEDYPYAYAEHPDQTQLATQVRGAIYYHYEQTGEELTFAEVMRSLDDYLEKREAERQQRLSAKRKGAPPGATERGNGAVKTANHGGESPSSLSTEDAAQRRTERAMTREERLEHHANRYARR